MKAEEEKQIRCSESSESKGGDSPKLTWTCKDQRQRPGLSELPGLWHFVKVAQERSPGTGCTNVAAGRCRPPAGQTHAAGGYVAGRHSLPDEQDQLPAPQEDGQEQQMDSSP